MAEISVFFVVRFVVSHCENKRSKPFSNWKKRGFSWSDLWSAIANTLTTKPFGQVSQIITICEIFALYCKKIVVRSQESRLAHHATASSYWHTSAKSPLSNHTKTEQKIVSDSFSARFYFPYLFPWSRSRVSAVRSATPRLPRSFCRRSGSFSRQSLSFD